MYSLSIYSKEILYKIHRFPLNIIHCRLLTTLFVLVVVDMALSEGLACDFKSGKVFYQGRGNLSNEIPWTWHQRQLKERPGFLVIRSLTLSSAPQWAGGMTCIRRFSLLSQKKVVVGQTGCAYLIEISSTPMKALNITDIFYLSNISSSIYVLFEIVVVLLYKPPLYNKTSHISFPNNKNTYSFRSINALAPR